MWAFEMLPRPVYYRALGGHVERQCTTSWPDPGTMGFIQSRWDEPRGGQEGASLCLVAMVKSYVRSTGSLGDTISGTRD